MKKLKLLTDIEESYTELRYKTSWPTKTQLIKSAIIVMIASIIIALVILCMDQVVERGSNYNISFLIRKEDKIEALRRLSETLFNEK